MLNLESTNNNLKFGGRSITKFMSYYLYSYPLIPNMFIFFNLQRVVRNKVAYICLGWKIESCFKPKLINAVSVQACFDMVWLFVLSFFKLSSQCSKFAS